MMPPSNAKPPSTYGPILSVLTPFITAVSDAIADVKTLGPLSLLSNHPMFFYKILKYNTYLIFKVTFSPRTPEQIFAPTVPMKTIVVIHRI